MKRIYTILSCLLLAGMLCIGLYALLDKDATYSESERRKLKTRPKLTFSAMLDGSYASDYRDYFADTFPNREKLMNANRSLNGFYYFSGGSKDGAQLVINMNGGAANHGEALPSTDDTTPSSSTQPSGTSGTATDSTKPTETTQPTQTQDPDAAAEELGSVLVVGDRAMEVPYGDKDTIRSYADAVNDIAAKLGSSVRTFSIAVPNAAAFYAPAENQHMLQTDMIAACYDRLKELKSTAIAVDAYSKLEAHKDEYLYFRSDHHWTALGAYYAYTAFCESAGLKAEPLSKFESGEYTGFQVCILNDLLGDGAPSLGDLSPVLYQSQTGAEGGNPVNACMALKTSVLLSNVCVLNVYTDAGDAHILVVAGIDKPYLTAVLVVNHGIGQF